MKATEMMRIELPAYPNRIFRFPQMFSNVMGDFSNRVCLGIATCQHMTPAKMGMVSVASNAMNRATKLVAYGENEIFGIEMLAYQLDCQKAIEDGCRYEFNTMTAMQVAHQEMYLHYLKLAVEIVDLVAEWMNNKDDKASKKKLAAISQLMAQCFILFKFSHVPSNYITHGTMVRIMPLMRFQAVGAISIDNGLQGEKDYAESAFPSSEWVLQEARNQYALHHHMWMGPLKTRVDQAYMREIAKYN